MGFTLRIGPGFKDHYEPCECTERCDGCDVPPSEPTPFINVPSLSNELAPEGTDTPQTNSCRPSYTSWSIFLNNCRLEDWFTKELMPNHPGAAPIMPYHLERMKEVDRASLNDWDTKRLDWILWWFDFTLKTHGGNSFFYNS